jgi:hypothetical protein
MGERKVFVEACFEKGTHAGKGEPCFSTCEARLTFRRVLRAKCEGSMRLHLCGQAFNAGHWRPLAMIEPLTKALVQSDQGGQR